MKSYRAYHNGLVYFADIMPTTINGYEEWSLDIYTRDWRGQKQLERHRLYRNRKSAETAPMRLYPKVEWSEV